MEKLLFFGQFAHSAHVDFMDGVFVPPVSWPFKPDQELGHLETTLVLEAHLMIADQRFAAELPAAGFSRVICHLEAFHDITEARMVITSLREEGVKEVGISIRSQTPIQKLHDIAQICDVVQVMGIESIGYQSQAFVPSTYDRIVEVKNAFPKAIVQVDGGVSEETVWALAQAGAERLVVGSAISERVDPKLSYEHLLSLAKG